MSDEMTADAGEDGAGLSLHDELAAALAAAPLEPLDLPPVGEVRPEAGKGVHGARDGGLQPPSPASPGPPPKGEDLASAPPPAWGAAAKAGFAALPEVIRAEVLRRESELERGQAAWDQKAARLDRLDAILAPRSEKLRLAGMDEAQALQALFAAQDLLERDPMTGLSYLARQYGLDLRRLGQPTGAGHPAQPAAAPTPELTRLAEEVLALKGAVIEQRTAAESHLQGETMGQIQAFAAEPSKLYFENVREAMAALLRVGRAVDLEDAYQQATWSDPQIRTLLLREQAEAAQAAAREAASAKAAQARRASGSLTGSPAPGATPGRAGPAASLRDELEAAFREHAA